MRLIVFDVDGTLVDSQAQIIASATAAFEECGLPTPPREAILSIVGLSLPEAMQRLMPDVPATLRAGLVEGYKSSYFDNRLAAGPEGGSPFFPGARALLDLLAGRSDIILGIATGKTRRGLDHVIDAHGLDGMFATLQVADDHPSKPHPSMLRAALAETGCAAADAVMIGDTTFDIEMGRSAGLRAVGVSWGYHPVADLVTAGADCIVSDFAALERELIGAGGAA